VGCPSFQEGLIVVFVVVLVLGASRLPQLGDALGRAVRNFKRGMKGENEIDVTPPKKRIEPPDED
jgi:sec-independent protein translocase protein TatA